MSVRVHSLSQVPRSGPSRRPAAWYAALFGAASLLFAAAPPAAAQTKSLPGTIQAEDFDAGGSGTAYKDSSAGNAGGQYRSTDVDIERCAEGGYNVGWTAAGEWLNYTVNVAAAGTYNLELRVASSSGGSLYVHFNGVNETGTITVPATGGWQNWTTIRKAVSLSAGTQSMKVSLNSGGLNLNSLTVSSGTTSTTSGSTGTTSSSAFGGTAHAIPGWVQAEDFDNGGKNVGYYDLTAGNAGGAYRATDVDIETTGSGGYAVGWVGAGEWLKYTVNVGSSGSYKVVARVASSGTGGTFHIEFNGTNKTGAMRVPNTGGWKTFQDLTATVSLSAGVQSMRVVFDTNGSGGAVGNLSAVRFDATTGSPAPAPTPTPTPEPDPTPSTGGGALRMLTWNIKFGEKGTAAQAQLIANSGAHVVALQEAATISENMPVTFRDRLKSLTGKTWYSVWAPHSGYVAGEGTLLLSRYPIVSSSVLTYEGRGFARAQIDVGGVRVQVFSVHLEYYDRAKRTRQLSGFMSWAKTFAGPRLAAGDFNSWWGESWIQTMETQYSDTWEMVTGSVQNGYTTGSVRFDYIFRAFTDESRATPTKCWVASSGGLSDHAPVVADFTVR